MAPKFPQRKLGDDLISALGLGCMSMAIPPYDDEESLKVLTEAADLGINFWVTSDAYGDTEKLIGRWFKETGRRGEIFIATKFGRLSVDGKMVFSSKPDYVKRACEASLERLQTHRIDLFSQHRVDFETPIEKTVEAMAQLKNEGKVRYLGLSECSAQTLRRAHQVYPIAAAEMEFSPFALEIESTQTNFLKMARELGVKIVAYAPLGKGFLTGVIKSRDDFDEKDMRRMFPRFSEGNFGDNLKLVEALALIAKEKSCTPDFFPLPGTKHTKYLKENAGAINAELSKEDDERIRNTIESVGGSKGARYPAAFLSSCFADSPELNGH